MRTFTRQWMGICAALLMVIPASALAQGAVDPDQLNPGSGLGSIVAARATVSETRTLAAGRLEALTVAPQATTGARIRRYSLGLGIGAGVGLVFGEVVLGQGLDFPHGPDMLIGMGMGAGVGALIAWAVDKHNFKAAGSKKQGLSIAPVLTPTRKAVMVTIALK